MPRLTLEREESETLREILESDLSDPRMEVADTDSYDFREMLERKEVSLKDLLTRSSTGDRAHPDARAAHGPMPRRAASCLARRRAP